MLDVKKELRQDQERMELFRQLFPEVFVNDVFEIDFFQRIASNLQVKVARAEDYGFSWSGKERATRESFTQPRGHLQSSPKESIDFSKTKNVFVEGDNLEVLKILQKTMQNSVKMIYIDPPYNANSGQSLYEDDFRFSKEELDLARSFEKRVLKTTGLAIYGRLHSRWLSMMYPRLVIAKELLTPDGVIFVSIDDVEAHNLRLIMNEIFGESNVEMMIWRKVDSNEGKLKLVRRFRVEHEYILVGYRNKGKTQFKKVKEKPIFRNPADNIDDDPRGEWASGNMSSTEEISVEGGKNYYEVTSPAGRKFRRQWKFPKEEFDRLNGDNRIYWGMNGNNVPRLKVFANEPRSVYVSSIIERKGTAKKAAAELRGLIGADAFPNPKPVELIRYLIDAAQTENGIIMDFFAGSGTTAQAVLEQNLADSGKRSFVLVQLPEGVETDLPNDSGTRFQKSTDIAKLRIRTLIERIKKKSIPDQLDLGMKVLKLVE